MRLDAGLNRVLTFGSIYLGRARVRRLTTPRNSFYIHERDVHELWAIYIRVHIESIKTKLQYHCWPA